MKSIIRKLEARRQTILVALLITVMVHALALMLAGEYFDLSPPEKPKKQEVVMVSMEPEAPEAPPAPEPDPAVAPPSPSNTPSPTPAKTPQQPVPTPAPRPVPTTEPTEATEATVTPETDSAPLSQEELARVNLDMSWKSFDHTFSEEATKAREVHVEASLEERRQTGMFSGMSAKVRKALERNKGWAAPGNQEPLGDRKKIFYSYIYKIHEERIHPIFGHGFWESLNSLGSAHELNDMSLHTLAEFEILQNGAVNEVRVVRTSGNTVFDAAAVNAVYQGSPFPPPPKEIVSWNGRVYLKWGFYRSRRMCGVFNVQPYILKDPDSEKEEVQIDEFINASPPVTRPPS